MLTIILALLLLDKLTKKCGQVEGVSLLLWDWGQRLNRDK